MHIVIFFSIADLPSPAHSFFSFFFFATPDLKSLKINKPLQFKKSLEVNPRPVCFVVLSQNLFLHNCKRHSIISQQNMADPHSNSLHKPNFQEQHQKLQSQDFPNSLQTIPASSSYYACCSQTPNTKQPNMQTCKIEVTKFVRTYAAGMTFLPC